LYVISDIRGISSYINQEGSGFCRSLQRDLLNGCFRRKWQLLSQFTWLSFLASMEAASQIADKQHFHFFILSADIA